LGEGHLISRLFYVRTCKSRGQLYLLARLFCVVIIENGLSDGRSREALGLHRIELCAISQESSRSLYTSCTLGWILIWHNIWFLSTQKKAPTDQSS